MSEDDVLDRDARFSLKDKKWMFMGVGMILAVVLVWLMVAITNPQKNIKPKPTLSPLSIDNSMLGDDEYEKFKDAVKTQGEVDESQQEEIQTLRSELARMRKEFGSNLEKFNQAAKEHMETGKSDAGDFRYPEPPEKPVKSRDTTLTDDFNKIKRTSGKALSVEQERLVGGLGHIQGLPEPVQKQKKTERYYLPPSFFDAKLLTGIDALTSKQGKENLEQIFFMVDAPAVLPNYIKKDLSGCFVVANAHGNLAKERVQVQAVNLSCLSSDGNAVIDEKILGFVTDEGDGKRDLAGNVVSRDASKLSWLFAASVVAEVGNSVNLSSFEQRNNVLGTSTVLNTDKLGERAVGASISSGAHSYKDIILEYIKQSGPVVEIGPLKNATIFVQQGVWLNVKQREEMEDDQSA